MATSRRDAAAQAGSVRQQETAPAPIEPADEASPVDVEPVVESKAVRPFMSEGTRQDMEIHGKATDPVSGAVFTLDRETGEVTVTERVARDE